MKVGAAMAFNQHTDAAFIRDAVQLVEEKGIDSIWLPEHVLFFFRTTHPPIRTAIPAVSRAIPKASSIRSRR